MPVSHQDKLGVCPPGLVDFDVDVGEHKPVLGDLIGQSGLVGLVRCSGERMKLVGRSEQLGVASLHVVDVDHSAVAVCRPGGHNIGGRSGGRTREDDPNETEYSTMRVTLPPVNRGRDRPPNSLPADCSELRGGQVAPRLLPSREKWLPIAVWLERCRACGVAHAVAFPACIYGAQHTRPLCRRSKRPFAVAWAGKRATPSDAADMAPFKIGP